MSVNRKLVSNNMVFHPFITFSYRSEQFTSKCSIEYFKYPEETGQNKTMDKSKKQYFRPSPMSNAKNEDIMKSNSTNSSKNVCKKSVTRYIYL